jgi:hypothetical protein
MKLRLLPVVITVLLSSGVLFGGWFAYQSFAMEDPFLEKVAAVEGIAGEPVVEIQREQAVVRIALEPGASLREAYRAIVEAGASSLGEREIVVEASNESSEALESWWSGALFDVAQAMETKQYSAIPQRLRELAEADGSMQVKTEMDDTNVYITLVDGPNSKHVILPRQAAMMGVWPNE